VVPGPFGTIENLSEPTCSRLAYPGGRTPVDEVLGRQVIEQECGQFGGERNRLAVTPVTLVIEFPVG
jgi:hypothetical protein